MRFGTPSGLTGGAIGESLYEGWGSILRGPKLLIIPIPVQRSSSKALMGPQR